MRDEREEKRAALALDGPLAGHLIVLPDDELTLTVMFSAPIRIKSVVYTETVYQVTHHDGCALATLLSCCARSVHS